MAKLIEPIMKIYSVSDISKIVRRTVVPRRLLFRGQNVDKPLLPRIARIASEKKIPYEDLNGIERRMLARLKKESPPVLNGLKPATDWEWLSSHSIKDCRRACSIGLQTPWRGYGSLSRWIRRKKAMGCFGFSRLSKKTKSPRQGATTSSIRHVRLCFSPFTSINELSRSQGGSLCIATRKARVNSFRLSDMEGFRNL